MTTETKKHYLLSPSAAHRWLVCPGEPTLRSSVPNNSTSYADEGTTAHWVGEQCLRGEQDPHDFVGAVCPETGMTVTAEMALTVKVYVDFCRSCAGKDWSGVEVQFTLPDLSPELGGTSDYSTAWGSTLEVVDFKNGSGYSVQAENNPQLRIYALGALFKLAAEQPDLFSRIKKVWPAIVQPRIEGEPALRREYLLLPELLEWRDKVLKPAILRTQTEKETYVAGDHCRFCPAKAVCPAQYKANLAVAQLDFAKPLVAMPTLPVPSALSVDQLSRVLQAKEQFESWLGAVEQHAQSVLASGKPVPGFKLVKKRSNRAWANEGIAEKVLVKALGASAYEPRKLLSVAKAEETLKAFDVKLEPSLIVKPDNGEVIAAVSDKRPEFVPTSAAAVFLANEEFLS